MIVIDEHAAMLYNALQLYLTKLMLLQLAFNLQVLCGEYLNLASLFTTKGPKTVGS